MKRNSYILFLVFFKVQLCLFIAQEQYSIGFKLYGSVNYI